MMPDHADAGSSPHGLLMRLRTFLLDTPVPREGLWLGLFFTLLASLPFLMTAYPQMVDYPAHLARFQIGRAHV